MQTTTIRLEACRFEKQDKTLLVSSEVTRGFKQAVDILSHYTGRLVRFVPITEDDPRFDQDHWDGEMAIYRPIKNLPNVKYLVVSHAF